MVLSLRASFRGGKHEIPDDARAANLDSLASSLQGQKREYSDLEKKLASFVGPFDIESTSDFATPEGSKEPQISITFKFGKSLITPTIKASSIDLFEDQSNKSDDASDVGDNTPDMPNTISFEFNSDLVEPFSWRMIDHPAKFITANHKAVRVEIHCAPEDSSEYIP